MSRCGLLRVPAQCLEHHERANTVIYRPRNQPAAGKFHRFRIDHPGISNRQPFLSLFLRVRPDVHPEVGHLRRLLALIRLHLVNRLLSHHAENIAVTAEEPDPLRNENLRVPSANRRDVRVSLVVNVSDDHANLVDVAGQHDCRSATGVHFGDAVSGDVGSHRGELRGLFPPHLCRCRFESGRAGRVEELMQKLERIVVEHRLALSCTLVCRNAGRI